MSIIAEDNVSHRLVQLHPDWVAMDMESIGKSFYNGEASSSDRDRLLGATTLYQLLQERAACDSSTSTTEETSGDSAQNTTDRAQNTPSDASVGAESPGEESAAPVNYLAQFRAIARSTDGLINNDLRTKIWPILLDIEDSSASTPTKSSKLTSGSTGFVLEDLDAIDLPPHKDEYQVKLDIQRSFTILNHIHSLHNLQSESFTTIFSKSDTDELKKHLSNLIIKILRKYPILNYYQGYHDIASIILLVCHIPSDTLKINEELAFKLLESFTLKHLRDFMIKDIQLSVNHLRLIPTLLENIEPKLFEVIKHSSVSYTVTNGVFYDYNLYPALSSILTWFSHDITSLQQILLIWDFCLSYDSVLANIYIYTATLVYFKDDILNQLSMLSVDDVEIDYETIDKDLLHTMISPANLFSKLSDIEMTKILTRAKTLIETYPIHTLENSASTYDVWFKEYNKNSVLMTTSTMINDIPIKQREYRRIKQSILEIVPVQDEEIFRQTNHEALLQQKILEQQQEDEEALSSSIDLDSNGNLLSSSLSLNSSTSTLNLKLANTSSMIFKKLFKSESWKSSDSSGDEAQKEVVPRSRKNILSFNNIYGISFTIGFIGFLIHFLLIRNDENMNHFNIFKYMNISPVKRLATSMLDLDSMSTIGSQLSQISGDAVREIALLFNNVRQYTQESAVIHQGIALGTIGLGNIRNTIYGFVS